MPCSSKTETEAPLDHRGGSREREFGYSGSLESSSDDSGDAALPPPLLEQCIFVESDDDWDSDGHVRSESERDDDVAGTALRSAGSLEGGCCGEARRARRHRRGEEDASAKRPSESTSPEYSRGQSRRSIYGKSENEAPADMRDRRLEKVQLSIHQPSCGKRRRTDSGAAVAALRPCGGECESVWRGRTGRPGAFAFLQVFQTDRELRTVVLGTAHFCLDLCAALGLPVVVAGCSLRFLHLLFLQLDYRKAPRAVMCGSCVLLSWKYFEDSISSIRNPRKLGTICRQICRMQVLPLGADVLPSGGVSALPASLWVFRDEGRELGRLRDQVKLFEVVLLRCINYNIGPVPSPFPFVAAFARFIWTASCISCRHQSPPLHDHARTRAQVVPNTECGSQRLGLQAILELSEGFVLDFFRTPFCLISNVKHIAAVAVWKASVVLRLDVEFSTLFDAAVRATEQQLVLGRAARVLKHEQLPKLEADERQQQHPPTAEPKNLNSASQQSTTSGRENCSTTTANSKQSETHRPANQLHPPLTPFIVRAADITARDFHIMLKRFRVLYDWLLEADQQHMQHSEPNKRILIESCGRYA